ncbi:MAG TPA: porin family protein [Alphaproteobacteria bacterium]|nr:porin family protein [Alphaproteobacteria bacterium]
MKCVAARPAAALALLVALAMLAPTAAQAQPADDRARAVALMDADRPAAACDLLQAAFGHDTPENDVVMMLAHCSWQAGRADDAISHYQTLIERLPAATRPRVELATLYLQLRRYEDAEAQFAAAQAIDPKAGAMPVLGGLARAMAADDPSALAAAATAKNWQVELFTGLVRDTNINSGPTAATVAGVIGGAPVDLTLSPDSHPKASWGNNSRVTARYIHPLDDSFALLVQGSLAKTVYFSDSAFDNDSAAAALALLYRRNGLTASLQPSARLTRQANDVSERTFGITGRASQTVADGVRLAGSLGYFHRDTPTNEWRNADGYLASLGVNADVTDDLQIGAAYLWQTEDAKADSESRTLRGPLLFASLDVTPELNLSASYRYSDIEYDARQAIFAEARHDREHIAGLIGVWDVSEYLLPGTALRAEYTFISNPSNLALFDNQRHIVTAGLQFTF